MNACLPFVAESAHDALATLLEAVPNATAWAAILRSYAAGMHGNAAGPSRLGEAIQDFVAGNWHKDRPTAKWFRGFVRSSRGQAQSAEHMDFDRDRCEELRMIREQNEKRRAQRLELKTEPTWATELDARYPDGRTFPHPSAA